MEQTNSAGHSAKKASILNCLVAIFCFNFILFTFYYCKPHGHSLCKLVKFIIMIMIMVGGLA